MRVIPMQKLSVLIFSKDDLEQALGLIRSLHGIADEIVLMDASGRAQRTWIAKQKEMIGLDKLKIHRVMALGYREPLMMYALKKCRNSWVLDLDTDMRLSDQLKIDVQQLIQSGRNDAYATAIYNVYGKDRGAFGSTQVRLFKKEKIEFTGMVHERPTVHGSFEVLPREKYFIKHLAMDELTQKKSSYDQMLRFQRFRYAQFNEHAIGQMRRIGAPKKSESTSARERFLLWLLRAYETLTLKKQEQEASNFDYSALWFMRVMAYHLSRLHGIRGMRIAVSETRIYSKEMKEWRNGRYGDEDFAIANIINRIGVIKFLGLENERSVDALNRKYIDKKQGVELLISLLREKYRKSR
jgi:hypothetical protein